MSPKLFSWSGIVFLLFPIVVVLTIAASPPPVSPNLAAACTPLTDPAQLPSPSQINFDLLADGTTIGNLYQGEHGVVFENAPTHRAEAQASFFASSLPNTAVNYTIPPNVSNNLPMTIQFDYPLTHVGLFAGGNPNFEAIITATLRAYDSLGNEICMVTAGPVLDVHALFIGLYDPSGSIRSVSLDYGDIYITESIDDLFFTYAPPTTPTATPTATPTHTPTPTPTPTTPPTSPIALFASPDQAAPGAMLTISGYGFAPATEVQLALTCPNSTIDPITLAIAMTDAAGLLRTTAPLPQVPPNPCLLAANMDGEQVATAEFTVLPALTLSLSPQQGAPGTLVHFDVANVQPGQLRLDYAGQAVFGPVDVAGGSFSGDFTVPNDRPDPLGSTTAVTANNLRNGQSIGQSTVNFQSQVGTPPPNYQVTNLVLPDANIPAGGIFTITGQISPAPQEPLAQFQIIPLWQKSDGSSFPIGTGPATIQTDGTFSVSARVPSLLTGDPAWPQDGDKVGVMLLAPGKAPQPNLTTAVNPWEITPLNVKVIDAQSKQTIIGAQVSLDVWDDSIQQVGQNVMAGNANQVKGVLNQNNLDLSEIIQIAIAEALCMDTQTVPTQNGIPLSNPILDQAFSQPPLGGLIGQNFDLTAQGINLAGQTAVITTQNLEAEGNIIHYVLKVNAFDQGYGVKQEDGTVKNFALRVDYNIFDHTYRTMDGQILPNPLTIELQKLTGELSVLGPINVLMDGIGAPEMDGSQPPIFRRYYSFQSVPANTQQIIISEGQVVITLSTNQEHLLGSGGIKLYIDGIFKNDVTLFFNTGVACHHTNPPKTSDPFYQGVAAIPNAHLLSPGIHTLELRAQLNTGQWVTYSYRLQVDPVPSTWFNTTSGASRILRWSPKGVEYFNTWLKPDTNFEILTSGNETDETGPLDNRVNPDMTTNTKAEANGHKGANNSGQLSGQTLNKNGFGCFIGNCPANTPAAKTAAATPLTSMTYGPYTEEVLPKITYNIPAFAAGIPFVAQVVAGGTFSYAASVVYSGEITVFDDASVDTTVKIVPIANISGGIWIHDYLLAGILQTGKIELDANFRVGMPVSFSLKNGKDVGQMCFQYNSTLTEYSGEICDPTGALGCVAEHKNTDVLFNGAMPKGCQLPGTLAAQSLQTSTPPPTLGVSLASNGFGEVMVVYQAATDALASSIWDGTAWSSPVVIPTGLGAVDPQVAYLSPTTAIALWVETNLNAGQLSGLSVENAIKARRIAYAIWDGTNWSAAQTLTVPSLGEGGPALATCPFWQSGCPAGGEAVAVWERNLSADFNARNIRLYYARYQNGSWTTPQPLDSAGTFTDILPQVAYVNGTPLVAWVRDSDTDLTDGSSRRIALRFIGGTSTFVPTELPAGIGEVALAVDGSGLPMLAFTQFENPSQVLSNQRPLWTARGSCSGIISCTWQPQQLVDGFGRTLYAEHPLIAANSMGNAVITFRGLGFGGDVEPQPGDAPGMVSGQGDLAQVVTDFSSTAVTPAYLTQDAAVNWLPAAAYDPILNTTIATAVKGSIPIGLQTRTAVPDSPASLASPAPNLPLAVTAVPSQPDFMLLSATPSTLYPVAGEPLTITVQIANAGMPWSWDGSTVEPLVILATWDSGPGEGTAAGQSTLPELSGMAEVTLTLTLPVSGLESPHELVLTVNPGFTQADWNPNNNQITITLGGVPAPTGIWAEVQPGSSLVFLDWDDLQMNGIAGYRIYRAEDNGAFQPVGSTFEHGYVDLNASVLHTYRYAVSAYTAAGQESALSASLTVTVPGIRVYLPVIQR